MTPWMPRLRRRRDAGLAPAPFVVASPRSGTTLLRIMLDSHPRLTIPPETHFVPELLEECGGGRGRTEPETVVSLLTGHRRWADFHLDPAELHDQLSAQPRLTASAALRCFYSLYAETQGKPRWGDKTPEYLLTMREIQAALPEARFVHVIRDGRDVALSRIRWRMKRAGKAPPVERLARRWKQWITRARRQARRVDHYLEVRFEDLVTETEPALRRICEFVELDWSPELLRYHERASARLQEIAQTLPAAEGRRELDAGQRISKHEMTTRPPTSERVAVWREEMSPEDRAAFERVAGGLLVDLGYPTEDRGRR